MKTQLKNNLRACLALNRLYGLRGNDVENLMQHHDDLVSLLTSSVSKLVNAGFSEGLIQQIKKIDWNMVDAEAVWAEKPNHHIITLLDDSYPSLLRGISAPPLVLFVNGNIACLNLPQLAMVGSRNPTSIGRETAQHFAHYLAGKGLVITSGLAMGIDAASHLGALQSGQTIAVLGTSIDQIYPSRHRELAERISANGAVISEFPLKTFPEKKNFPRRNRIISGLSAGTLVVEAALRSGSWITARHAGEQGREVFAIPGSIHNPLARGCHKLIKEGAKLVETAEDILGELKMDLTPALIKKRGENSKDYVPSKGEGKIMPTKENLDADAVKLLSSVGFEATAIDTLVVRTDFSPEVVSSMLLILELGGLVKRVPGGYCRKQE
jgi:DNA processing protein